MKINIYILFISLFLISCDKEKEEAICSASSFLFLNEKGEDIFNKNTINYIESSELFVFTPEGNRFPVNTFTINDVNYFQFGINGANNPGLISTTYLQLGDLTIDTITAKFLEVENSLFINELFYNGVLLEKNSNVTTCGTHTHEIVIFKE
jgi:hypothetical protein